MWMITKDKISGPDVASRKGKVSHDWKADRAKLPMTRFRLLDDDCNVYYYGKMPDEDINGDETIAFAPLDWAMNDAGCTIMEYYSKTDKAWKML